MSVDWPLTESRAEPPAYLVGYFAFFLCEGLLTVAAFNLRRSIGGEEHAASGITGLVDGSLVAVCFRNASLIQQNLKIGSADMAIGVLILGLGISFLTYSSLCAIFRRLNSSRIALE